MDRRIWRQFDLVLVGIVVLLILYGVIMVFSANQNQEDLNEFQKTMQIFRTDRSLTSYIRSFP